jgi:acyl-CoA synthetase (AMP-forming)/AMP-acid ligase II
MEGWASVEEVTTLYRGLRLADGMRAIALREPTRMALRCGPREMSYGELRERAARVSSAALAAGIKVGDRVALLAPNCFEYPEIMCGLSDIGAIIATLNPRSAPGEIAAACVDCQPVMFIYHHSLRDVAIAARESAEFPKATTTIETGEPYETWLAAQAPLPIEDLPSISETDPFTLVYSSGTTGQPKGIVISHRSRTLTFHAMAMEYGCYGPDDRFLALAPMSHGAGFAFAMGTLYFGGFVEIAEKFDPLIVLERLAVGGFTGVFMVPTHFQAILSLPAEVLDRYRGTAHSLRCIISNAAALPQLLKEKIIDYFGEGLLHETYGSTEAGIVTNIRPSDQLKTNRSVGRPFALNEVRLLSPDGTEVADGEVGELFSRSPYHFNGYWGHPEWLTDCTRPGGWLSAGDLARRDQNGFLYIVDRKKDMVISGGFNIYPREVETVLEQHPAVREACVVGVPDDHWGERLRAFIVVQPGLQKDDSLATALAYSCKDLLSAFKIPREFAFIDDIPRNVGGKTLKRALRTRDVICHVVHIREPTVHAGA